MRLSQSTHLLMSLSLETLTSIIKIGYSNLAELIDLVNFVVIFFKSQMTLLRWSTFLLRFLTVTLAVLLFWICFHLMILVFFLQLPSLHWVILIMLSQFPLTFYKTQNGILISLYSL